MKLIPNWKRVLKHGHSIRWFALAGIFSGAEAALPIINQVVNIPQGAFAVLTLAATGLGMFFRLVAQEKVSGNED